MAVLNLYPAAAYTNGELLTQTVLNTPLQLIQAWSTTIDNTNIGSAGIYASQLSPTNNVQATFGGISGYFFTAASANTTPLTITSLASAVAQTLVVNMGTSQSMAGLQVNGAASITGNLQEWYLTPGGTLAAKVDKSGNLTAVAGTFSGLIEATATGIQCAPTINSTNTLGYVPPVYTHAGAAQSSTGHIIMDTFTGNGSSVTVTFSGSAVFSTYATTNIYDVTGSQNFAVIGATLTGFTATSTTNGHTYYYYTIGY